MVEGETIRPARPGLAASDPDAELSRRVKAMPKPVFAVMDGARFADLPGELAALGLARRSLFLDHADVEVERAGGWLVPLASEAQIDAVITMMRRRPAAVFWSCPDGEAALHRHLRTINLVVVPLPSEDAPASDAAAAVTLEDETVLFRHYDPNIMASLLRLLDEAQFARIFGPATYMVMYTPDYGGPRRAPRPEDLPIAPSGPLRINEAQMLALEEARSEKARRKIGDFLRTAVPGKAQGMDDEELRAFVLESETSARGYGMTSERAMGQWAALMLESNGGIGHDATVRRYFRDESTYGSANDKMHSLMERLGRLPSSPMAAHGAHRV